MKTKYQVGKGAEQYLRQMEELGTKSKSMIGMAIYKGAEVVTDAIRAEIEMLPTHRGFRRAKEGEMIDTISEAQKRGLLNGLGIATMKNDGGVYNVKVGMDGYNTTVSKRWPRGQPNAMVMRSIESGTSFMQKNPVITKAVRRVKPEAERVMGKVINDYINKSTEGGK